MIFVDFETQSACELSNTSGRIYAEHPSTRILSLVAAIGDEYHVWLPAHVGTITPTKPLWPTAFGPPKPIIYHNSGGPPAIPGEVMVAHNAEKFDKHIWRTCVKKPGKWLDTMPYARAGGYPGSLDKLGEMIFGQGKDQGGKFLDRLMKARWRDGWEYPPPQPGFVTEVLRYNVADVILLQEIYKRVKDFGEPNVIALDSAINERGLQFDSKLAQTIIRLSQDNIAAALQEIQKITDGSLNTETHLRSHIHMKEWLKSMNVNMPNLQQKTVEAFIDNPDFGDGDEEEPGVTINPVVFDVLRLRQAVMRVTSGKLERALNTLSPDQRIRDAYVYYGAHTGRWSSQGVQVHNITRGKEGINATRCIMDFDSGRLDYSSLVESRAPKSTVDDVLSVLIRPCITAAPGKQLLIADYNAIEARCVAWLANENRLLDIFKANKDPYCDMASGIYGRTITDKKSIERRVGKPAVLGAGYGMGGPKFAGYAAKEGVDLEAAGVTPDQVIQAYRNRFPDIAGYVTGNYLGRPVRKNGLWQKVYAAAKLTVEKGGENIAAKCTFYRDGTELIIVLPSGRKLHYRNVRIEDVVPGYCQALGIPAKPKPTIVYDSPKGTSYLSFGGKIVENISQAICRDLLADALIKCEDAGLNPVGHVHDEIICEVTDPKIDQLVKLMSTPPTWADGFPIKVEGFTSRRYVKAALPGSIESCFINGDKKM